MPAEFACREYGDAAVLIEVHGAEYEERWAAAQTLGEGLRATGLDVLATYQHVFVSFDPRCLTSADVRAAVDALADAQVVRPEGRTFEIPVVYDGEDLRDVAAELSLSVDELVALHTSREWTLRYVASPHGAPFLEGPRFPAPVPRLRTPRVRTPPGSVSVSGRQTTIYTTPSPGGWRILGRTSLQLFDHRADPPVPYRAGDSVRFVAT